MFRLVVVCIAMSLSLTAWANEPSKKEDPFIPIISGLEHSPLEGYWVIDLEKLREDPRYESNSRKHDMWARTILMMTPNRITIRSRDGNETLDGRTVVEGTYSVKEKKGYTVIEFETLNRRGEKSRGACHAGCGKLHGNEEGVRRKPDMDSL